MSASILVQVGLSNQCCTVELTWTINGSYAIFSGSGFKGLKVAEAVTNDTIKKCANVEAKK